MGQGFQSFNDSGTIQFDSESPNYGYVGKVNIVTTPINNVGDPQVPPGADYSIGLADNLPTFDTYAIRCSQTAAQGGLIGFQDSNSLVVYARGVQVTVTAYLYRSFSKLTPANTGQGLEVFDPSGKLTFSTAYRPLAIVQRVPITNQRVDMNDYYAHPQSRGYAFIRYGVNTRDYQTFVPGNADVPGSTPFNGSTIGAYSPNTDGFYVQELGGYMVGNGPVGNGGFLVVDVNGL